MIRPQMSLYRRAGHNAADEVDSRSALPSGAGALRYNFRPSMPGSTDA